MPSIVSGKLFTPAIRNTRNIGTCTKRALGDRKENWLLKYFNYDGANCLTWLIPNSIQYSECDECKISVKMTLKFYQKSTRL